MGPISVALVVAAAVAAGGAGMLVVGLRGRRVDEHPLCRRCGFDLFGLYPGATGCPECGAALGPRGLRIGNRRARRGVAAIGAAVLVVITGLGVLIAVQTARGFDWNTVKPVWLLVSEASGSDRPGPVRELALRVRQKDLDPARLGPLVGPILERQGDASRAWNPELGDLFAAAWGAGAATPEQARRFAMAGTNVELAAARASGGGVVIGAVATKLRGASAVAAVVWLRPVAAEIDGRPVDLGDGLGLAFALQSGLTCRATQPLREGDSRGARLSIRWEARARGVGDLRGVPLDPWEIVTAVDLPDGAPSPGAGAGGG